MTALQPLKFLTVAARAKHTATVIFVHGLGDTGYGWKDVADQFSRDEALSHVKWVLPHAPVKPVTANMGAPMPSWFDIHSFDFTSEDEPGMLQTVRSLNELVTAEVDAGIPADRVVLGGFSQGAAMTLLTGFTTERKLAGVAVLSGWMPLKTKIKSMINSHVKSLPIFWGHGKADPLVKYQWGANSVEFIVSQLGARRIDNSETVNSSPGVSFHSYEGVTHSVSMEELSDLQNWLKQIVPRKHD